MDAPVSFRTLLRRRAPTILCAVGGVLLVLALILGTVYRAFEDIALRSISLRDVEFSAQTDALSDLMEGMIRNYGMQTFYAPEVLELLEEENLTAAQQARDLRELGTYVSSSDFVDSITIYNRQENMIYATDSDVLSDTADQFVDRSAAEMFLNLDADMRMTPLRRTAFLGQKGREKVYFSFLFFETNAEDEPTGGAMMLDVPFRWFVDNLLSFDNRGSCVLLDRRGTMIYAPHGELEQTAEFFLSQPDFAAVAEREGYLLQSYKDRQMVCHFSKIKTNDWLCLRILPMEECLPGLSQLRNLMAAGFTFGVMLLAIASVGTLIFLYTPFRKIRLALQRISPQHSATETQITELVQDSLQYQQSHLLMDLLEGRVTRPQRLPPPPLTLLLIACPDQACARALVLEECPSALLRHEQGCDVALLPAVSELDVMALCGALTTRAGCRCYCSVPLHQAALIPESYATLRELQLQRFWYPGQQILSEKNFAPRTAGSGCSEKQLAALLAALRAGEKEAGLAQWKEILDGVRGASYRDQRFVFHRVAQLLEETLTEQGQPTEQILTDEFLAQLEDIGSLTAHFNVFFAQICQHSIDHRRRRLGDLAAQVAHRIDVGYEDSELSPPRIADEMGMSSAYLGRLFRESLGQSIGEYMNRVRVENGSRLLSTTDLTVEAIAAAVGFGNPKYFFVVFKSVTGKTPLQFRKQAQAASEGK